MQGYVHQSNRVELNVRRALKKQDQVWKTQDGQSFASLTVACLPRKQAKLVETLNRLIRKGTERVPLGGVPFGGALLGRDDISRVQDHKAFEAISDDDKNPQLDPGRPKKVLILMSDTGGGHRASAEALKATFELEFGEEFEVSVCAFIFWLKEPLIETDSNHTTISSVPGMSIRLVLLFCMKISLKIHLVCISCTSIFLH